MESIKLENITENPESSFERGANPFLSAIMRKIRSDYESDRKVEEESAPAGMYYISARYAEKPYKLPFVYFDTRGCKFDKAGACTMCNFGRDTKHTEDETFEAVGSVIESVKDQPFIQIVSSGSFLDEWEVSPHQRQRILDAVAERGFETVGTESRAEFITEEKAKQLRKTLGQDTEIEMGIGLETVDPTISKYSINKMFSPERYKSAVRNLKENGINIFSHALLKPAFLTEREAYEDVVKTIKWAFENGSDSAGIGIMNLKKGTLNHWLAERGEYRVPWLWTVAKIFRDLPQETSQKVTAFGFESGIPIEGEAMNCNICSPDIKRMLNQYIETRDAGILDEIDRYQCSCKSEWEETMTEEARPLAERLPDIYKKIAEQFKGLGDASTINSLIKKSVPNSNHNPFEER